MKVYHIIPKTKQILQFGKSVITVREICAAAAGRPWQIHTESAGPIADMAALEQAVQNRFPMCQPLTVCHHDDGLPPTEDEAENNAYFESLCDRDALMTPEVPEEPQDSQDSYAIPHEDTYDNLYDEPEELQDEAYLRQQTDLAMQA